jgi:DNA-binding CsgD family transcriptional regulator
VTIRVFLHTPDAITAAGIATLLAGEPAVTVLRSSDDAAPEVLVAAGRSAMRAGSSEASGGRAGPATGDERLPIVLIADDVTEADVAVLTTRYPGAVVVPRRRVSAKALVTGIATAAEGGFQIGEDTGDQLLSRRELEVLRLVADGYDTAEIAVRLGRSARTVKQILGNVTTRSRLRNRTHAVAFAIRAGLL